MQGQRAEACKNHLHQMHICLPSRKGHTRLLYRMSLDFMNWTRFVPGIQLFWQNIANQVWLWHPMEKACDVSLVRLEVEC